MTQKKSFADLINQLKFNPKSIKYIPSPNTIKNLLWKYNLYNVDIISLLNEINDRLIENDEELESFIENEAYFKHNDCYICKGLGCKKCVL